MIRSKRIGTIAADSGIQTGLVPDHADIRVDSIPDNPPFTDARTAPLDKSLLQRKPRWRSRPKRRTTCAGSSA